MRPSPRNFPALASRRSPTTTSAQPRRQSRPRRPNSSQEVTLTSHDVTCYRHASEARSVIQFTNAFSPSNLPIDRSTDRSLYFCFLSSDRNLFLTSRCHPAENEIILTKLYFCKKMTTTATTTMTMVIMIMIMMSIADNLRKVEKFRFRYNFFGPVQKNFFVSCKRQFFNLCNRFHPIGNEARSDHPIRSLSIK